MILSQKQIEDIAEATMNDFNEFFFGNSIEAKQIHATPIDQFARDFLHLDVRFEHLSSDGSLCGITAYTDTEYVLNESGMLRTIPIKNNEILLEKSFIDPSQIRTLCGKRRFTLAHECAHQLLFHMDDEEGQTACRRMYSERRAYSLRDLKTKEDWNEWQANALGAAILMPKREIAGLIKCWNNGRTLISRFGQLSTREEVLVTDMSEFFHASKTALKIRLKRLGFLADKEETAVLRKEVVQ